MSTKKSAMATIVLVGSSMCVACATETMQAGDPGDIGGQHQALTGGFPRGLALASPFARAGAHRGRPGALAAPLAEYTAMAEEAAAVLDGTAALADVFELRDLTQRPTNPLCFGPNVIYENHPEGGSTVMDPMTGHPVLPTGDLGIWLESDTDTGEACAASVLNAKMSGVGSQARVALLMLAEARREAALADADGSLDPGDDLDLTTQFAALALADVTVTAASVRSVASASYDAVFHYTLDLQVTQDGVARQLMIELDHADSGDNYVGRLRITQERDIAELATGNACDMATDPSHGFWITDLMYDRESEDQMSVQARSGAFCGNSPSVEAVTLGDLELDLLTSQPINGAGVETNWAGNYHLFVGDFDPGSLAGEYTYAWQAGSGDSNSRVLAVELTGEASAGLADLTGTSFYGYGAAMDSFGGSIDGFYCDWLAHSGSRAMSESAQRQVLAFDSLLNQFAAAESNIEYAPTSTCNYDGSGTYVFDRDLDRDLTDEDPALAVENGLFDTDSDNDGTADYTTLSDALDAAGFMVPSALGGWPSDS